MKTLQSLLQEYNYNLFKIGDHDLKEQPASVPQDVQKRVSVLAVPCYTVFIDEARFKIALDIRVGAALSRLEAARLALEFTGDPDAEERTQSPETHTTQNPQVSITHSVGQRERSDADRFGVTTNSPTIAPVTTSLDKAYTDTNTTNAHDVVNVVGERREVRQKIMSPVQAYQRREAYNAEVFDCLTEILRGAIFEGSVLR